MLTRATLQNRPSPRNLLARVLETPDLSTQVQALPAPLLGKLIDQVGLEDAGELVALATTAQLAEIFDEDLWHSARAGEDERFDSERFVLWLEILLEAGDKAVAERLAELPQELVTLAFHRHLLVLSLDDLRTELGAGDDEADAAEKAFESSLNEELEDYQVIWRGGEGFDSVLAALLALDRDHHSLAVDLLERCAALSSEFIEDNGGLYEVLSSEQMLEQDLAGERETRRAERGYVAPSAAAAFLRLACRAERDETPVSEHDPLTRAYFRELGRASTASSAPANRKPSSPPRDLAALLAASGITRDDPAPARLTAGSSRRSEPRLIAALRELSEQAPEKFTERSEELAYLSNVLVAGASVDERRLRPLEAVEHAIDCVSLGLALARLASPAASDAQVLAAHPCDGLFRWALRAAREKTHQARPKVERELMSRVQSFIKQLKI
jgi:uncharacterized protein DUF6178